MERWFLWITLLLALATFGISMLIPVDPNATNNTNQNNCKPNTTGMITNLSVGVSNTAAGYCPLGMKSLGGSSIMDPSNQHVAQLCYEADQVICDNSSLLQDLKFVNMTDPKTGKYEPLASRCPDGYVAPFTSILPIPQYNDSGMIPFSSSTCPKMGLCVKTGSTAATALKIADIQIANSTDASGDQQLSGDEVCTKWLSQTGYTTDKVNLFGTPSCSNNHAIYVCQKKK